METIKLENMTFGELDEFTNEWIIKTKDFKDVFLNQADECNHLFKVNKCSDVKCCAIQNRFNYLLYWYNLIENILGIVGCFIQSLEQKVLKLEEKTKLLYRDDVLIDCSRVRIFDICLEVNRLVSTTYSKLEELIYLTIQNEKGDVSDNVAELTARILMNQLYQLERVEQTTQSALNHISCNDCKFLRCKCMYGGQTQANYKRK